MIFTRVMGRSNEKCGAVWRNYRTNVCDEIFECYLVTALFTVICLCLHVFHFINSVKNWNLTVSFISKWTVLRQSICVGHWSLDD